MTDILNHINQINPINHGSDNSYDIIKAHGGGKKRKGKGGGGGGFFFFFLWIK